MKQIVCVHVLKRSGEPLEVRSQWPDLIDIVNNSDTVDDLEKLFEDHKLSSRLAYVVQRDAPILSGLVSDARRSGLKVLLTRQSDEGFKDVDKWAERLNAWAAGMDVYLPMEEAMKSGFTEMAKWLILSRFLAERGGE